MPIDLTPDELATAAQVCRAMAFREGENAKKIENPRWWPRLSAVKASDGRPLTPPARVSSTKA